MKKSTIYLIISIIIFSLHICIYKTYAIEKPSYADFIRSQTGKNLTDEEIKIIKEWNELIDSIGQTKEDNDEKDTDENRNKKIIDKKENVELEYGLFKNQYAGIKNFRKNNFLLVMYSLLDVDALPNRQPLINTSYNDVDSYKSYGFEKFNSNKFNGLTSLNSIRWGLFQFEANKLFKTLNVNDRVQTSQVLMDLFDGKIAKHMTLGENSLEVLYLEDYNNKLLYNLAPGDILLYVENQHVIDYGIYLGYDEEGDFYSLSFHKHVSNVNEENTGKYTYMQEVTALSYINSNKIYPQEINGTINFIPGTKYNYVLMMKYID